MNSLHFVYINPFCSTWFQRMQDGQSSSLLKIINRKKCIYNLNFKAKVQLIYLVWAYIKLALHLNYMWPAAAVTPWRNGSASDSRSEGCVFKSRRGQIFSKLHMQTSNCTRLFALISYAWKRKCILWAEWKQARHVAFLSEMKSRLINISFGIQHTINMDREGLYSALYQDCMHSMGLY